jgi:hypothetical protein
MKNQSFILAGLFCLLLFLHHSVQANVPEDYFVGKWDVLIKGLPNGDANMVLVLEKGAKSMEGVVYDTRGNKIGNVDSSKLSKDKATLTLYFVFNGYDVNLQLVKVDEDNLKGNLMGMFKAEGSRMKAGE